MLSSDQLSALYKILFRLWQHERDYFFKPAWQRTTPYVITCPLPGNGQLITTDHCRTNFVPGAKFVPGTSSLRNPFQTCLATDDRVE